MKCFCIKDLPVFIKDIHKMNIQGGSCAKECQLNQEKPQLVKDSSYTLPKKTNEKMSKAYFLSSKLTSGVSLT